MSIEFWKFVNTRFKYINHRLLIFLWTLIIGGICGVDEWLGSFNIWLEFSYKQLHLFTSLYVFTVAVFGLYAMRKVSKHQHRENMARFERERVEFEARMDARWEVLAGRADREEREMR